MAKSSRDDTMEDVASAVYEVNINCMSLCASGGYDEAIDLADDFIARYPQIDIGYMLKATALGQSGMWRDAIKCLDQVWNPATAYPEIMLIRAHLLVNAGDADESLRLIDRAAKMGIDPVHLYSCKGRVLNTIFYNNGDRAALDEAIICMRKACKLAKTDADAHEILAGLFLARFFDDDKTTIADATAAYKHAKRAIKLGHDTYTAYYTMGRAILFHDRPDMAIKCFKKTLKMNPDFVAARAMIGTVMATINGRRRAYYEKALAYIDEALAIDPSITFATTPRFAALVKIGRAKEAISEIEEYTVKQPADPMGWTILAIAYRSESDHKQEARCLEKLRALNPDLADMHESEHPVIRDYVLPES